MGPADFIRADGQFVIWQYHQPHCVVDFFIPFSHSGSPSASPSNSQSGMSISHYFTRSRLRAAPLDPAKCQADFNARRR